MAEVGAARVMAPFTAQVSAQLMAQVLAAQVINDPAKRPGGKVDGGP